MSLFERLCAELKGCKFAKAFKIQGIAFDNYIVGNLTDEQYSKIYFSCEYVMNGGILS